jgi:hypothetical protein
MSIINIKVIGRKHTTNNGKHVCVTPTLLTFSGGFKMFHDLKNNKGLFINTTNWFWLPAEGFYGIFEIRETELALVDFYDFTAFDEELMSQVDYLAGA